MIDYEKLVSPEQFDVIRCDNSILLRACPGSGKTRTITYKIGYILENDLNEGRKIVAITYTNRAAEEIIDRINKLNLDLSRLWIGTIHQFCLEFVIKKHKRDNELIKKGYRIIDEYEQEKIRTEINEKLINKIVILDLNYVLDINGNPTVTSEREKNFLVKYYKYLDDNKLIDFDQILYIAYDLLAKNTELCRRQKRLISHFLIDEYQDTQELQYQILKSIINSENNISTEVFFAGDIDQAIYTSIGGVVKDLNQLKELFPFNTITEKNLSGCYRSTQQIVNYYSNFLNKYYKIEAVGENKNFQSSVIYISEIDSNDNLIELISNIIKQEIGKGVPEEEICVIAPNWFLIFPIIKKLKKLLPNTKFDAPDVSAIKRDPLNLFYNLSKCLLLDFKYEHYHKFFYCSKQIKLLLDEIFSININLADKDLINLIINNKSDKLIGTDFIDDSINKIFGLLDIKLEDNCPLNEAFKEFMLKIYDRIRRHGLENTSEAFKLMYSEKDGIVISSCHGVKGEEYHTVIAFGLLDGKVPHWKEMKFNPQNAIISGKRLFYVTASRAKVNLFFISENRSDRFGRRMLPSCILRKLSFDDYDDLVL